MTSPLLLIGCGKMGRALLEGWLERGIEVSTIFVVEANIDAANALREHYGITVVTTANDIDENITPAVVVFAVKPQVMDDVAPAYAKYAGRGCVFMSIAAGKTIKYFTAKLGHEAAIVRCMPNMPAAVRRGVSVACSNKLVVPDQQRLCHDLMQAVGEMAWVDDEDLLDAVTAVSGSGPAYVFLLAECLACAAIKVGLPDDLARLLATATVSGAGELMHQSTIAPETLRHNVTSPGGTTAEALNVLMADNGLQHLLNKAVAAATRRSRELAV